MTSYISFHVRGVSSLIEARDKAFPLACRVLGVTEEEGCNLDLDGEATLEDLATGLPVLFDFTARATRKEDRF